MRHVCGEVTSDAPAEVEVGQRLTVHTIAPLVRLPVEVTEVDPGRSWTMVARLPLGRVESAHVITDDDARTTVSVTVSWQGPRAVGEVLLRTYEPLARYAVRRLVSLAEADEELE